MLKKTFAAAAVAGLLVLGGSSAAFAAGTDDGYPVVESLIASPAAITVGGTSTITATFAGDVEIDEVSFVTTTGGTVSSLVRASATPPVVKPIVDGVATASFTATAAGTYVVAVLDGATELDTVTVTVAAAGTPTTAPSLPATGGAIPAAAIWLGVGAIGIGGIAVAAGVARRRASVKN